MNPGKLRHRVAILQKQTGVDPDGYPTEMWSTTATVWAAVEPIAGREYFQAAAVQAQNQTRFTMRYRKLTPDMRLQHDGQDYGVKSVLNLGGRYVWLQVMAEVVTSG